MSDVVAVRRIAARWFVVTALTLSVGWHWALLQSVAWVGMTVSYAKDAPLRVALAKAFDGQHPCQICKFVQAGQQSSKKSEFEKADLRIDLVCHRSEAALTPPRLAPLRYLSASDWSARLMAPPSPPPRSM